MKINTLFLIVFFLFLFESCEEAVERDLVADKVTLFAPIDSLVTTDTSISLHWLELKGASKYQIQIVSPRFDSIVRIVSDSSLSSLSLFTHLSRGAYEWRVRAKNYSSASQYSNIRRLYIQ